ncbi:MAG: hypothetical protein K2N06_12045 [Oscillospiraceae bacterium]|nr:hypothetical protein [Oscillospiraceae bacterium]
MTLDETLDSAQESDWRINGQEEFLMNKTLVREYYTKGGHEHCVFCWQKFMRESERPFYPDVDFVSKGYITLDGKYWICEKCCDDFKERFNWKIL